MDVHDKSGVLNGPNCFNARAGFSPRPNSLGVWAGLLVGNRAAVYILCVSGVFVMFREMICRRNILVILCSRGEFQLTGRRCENVIFWAECVMGLPTIHRRQIPYR